MDISLDSEHKQAWAIEHGGDCRYPKESPQADSAQPIPQDWQGRKAEYGAAGISPTRRSVLYTHCYHVFLSYSFYSYYSYSLFLFLFIPLFYFLLFIISVLSYSYSFYYSYLLHSSYSILFLDSYSSASYLLSILFFLPFYIFFFYCILAPLPALLFIDYSFSRVCLRGLMCAEFGGYFLGFGVFMPSRGVLACHRAMTFGGGDIRHDIIVDN